MYNFTGDVHLHDVEFGRFETNEDAFTIEKKLDYVVCILCTWTCYAESFAPYVQIVLGIVL